MPFVSQIPRIQSIFVDEVRATLTTSNSNAIFAQFRTTPTSVLKKLSNPLSGCKQTYRFSTNSLTMAELICAGYSNFSLPTGTVLVMRALTKKDTSIFITLNRKNFKSLWLHCFEWFKYLIEQVSSMIKVRKIMDLYLSLVFLLFCIGIEGILSCNNFWR